MLVRHVSDAKIHVFPDSDKRRLERCSRGFMLTPIKIPYSAYIAILKYYKKNAVFLYIWNICYIFAITKR